MAESIRSITHRMLVLSLWIASWGMAAQLPNIVIVYTDDLGFGDLSIYNPQAAYKTPRIDRMAREGIRFTDAHSPSTICSPSRYGLYSGQQIFRSTGRGGGAFEGPGGPSYLKPGTLTLGAMLQARGYRTGVFGKWHVGLTWYDDAGKRLGGGFANSKLINYEKSTPLKDGPNNRGFDESFVTPNCPTTDPLYVYIENGMVKVPATVQHKRSNLPNLDGWLWDNDEGFMSVGYDFENADKIFYDKTVKFIEGHLDKHKGTPFFAVLSTQIAHAPVLPAEEFRGKTTGGPRGDFVWELDVLVGRLLDTLDDLGIGDNTLVLFNSDNGAETVHYHRMRQEHDHDASGGWRGMKRDGWEGGHRVPFIARWPRAIPPGQVSKQMTNTTDIFATLASVVGYELKDEDARDSFDMLPVMLGIQDEDDPIRPHMLTQSFRGEFQIRQGPWKYLDHMLSGGNNYTGGYMAQYLLPEKAPNATGQLFHLGRDPGETTNLFFEAAEKRRALQTLLSHLKSSGRSAPEGRKPIGIENIPLRHDVPVESAVSVDVDWPAYMARQDLVWEILPTHFDYGAFAGNGMLGCMIYQDGDNRLRWEMGRSDVTEHRRDNARLPIGGLVLTTVGKIEHGTMRLDLWHAEIRGTVHTDRGSVTFRSFIHTDKMVLLTDLNTTGDEARAAFSWDARECQDFRNAKRFQDPPNPPAVNDVINGIETCTQPLFAGGQFTTAWQEISLRQGRRVILSIADSFPQTTARDLAVHTVKETESTEFATLLESHRRWWHDFYPRSLVSVPDPGLESFYWIQFYKLACASRPHLVPVDLLGPWYRNTGWPRIWWNLNIETLYLPVYTGNRLELGESFTNFIDAKRANFYKNARDIWGFDGCATVPHTTDYEGLRGDGSCAPDKYINPGDFTWALHNYYLHYRYSMDHSRVTDQSAHAFYPLLRDSINLYLKLLKKGEDGKLHLPVLHSPEYGDDADNNYNLSLLRWGCQTLIDLNERYDLNDPLMPAWRQTLKDLVPYPVDDNGLRLGAHISITKSHRHWSHILMVHPLHIMTGDQPENRALLNKSVLHWLTVDNSRGINGWSRAAAASLYATLGDGDNAIKQIHGHMADARFVRPNTMYIEGSPVIECSIVLNRSLQDMLLQSWGDKIAVFPAMPTTWDRAVFHELRAQGAFLVSAERTHGKTVWVRIKSLAGEPCRVQPGLGAKPTLLINGHGAAIPPSPDGTYDLPLARGDEAVLFTGSTAPSFVIRPVPAPRSTHNPHGVKRVK